MCVAAAVPKSDKYVNDCCVENYSIQCAKYYENYGYGCKSFVRYNERG